MHSEDNPPGYFPSDIAMPLMNFTMISSEPLIQFNSLIYRFYLTGAKVTAYLEILTIAKQKINHNE